MSVYANRRLRIERLRREVPEGVEQGGGFIRPALLHFFSPRDKEDNAYLPSATEMRRSSFFGYVLVAVLLHESIFFSLEAFTLYNWQELLINIATSSALTTLIIIAIESIRSSVRTTPKE